MKNEDCNITHGIITKIEGKIITVHIQQAESCSSCAAAGICEKTSSKGKLLKINQNNAEIFSIGERVIVNTPQSKSLKAIRLAFLYPILLMAVVVVFKEFIDFSDNILAVVCMLVVAIYYLFLYLMRHNKLFNFNIFISKE